jgi:PAS domain S-box-containing protein
MESSQFPSHDEDRETERLAADSSEQARLRREALREQALRETAERQQRKQAAALEALNRAATTLVAERGLETIVQSATDAGREISGAAFGAFFYNRVDESGELYQLYTLSGAPREAFSRFPMPRNTPIFAPTFEGRGPVRYDDVMGSPEYGKLAPHHGMPKGHLPVRSYLAVPVLSRTGQVLGGLFYGHPEPAMFDEAAERNLVSLAALAAVAIDNANLYEALQKEIAQGRVRENAARHFSALVASSSDAIISKDLSSIVTSWNASAERIFGYSAREMIGQSIVRLIPEELRDEEPEILRRIQAGETISSFETLRRRKDGKLINISLTISPIKDEAGTIIGASKIARDITAIKTAQEQLRQAQKMEAVGRLAGGIAHDFNNLLTSILGFAGMASDEAAPDSALAEYLREVRKAGERASTLTQQLLAYSRKQVMAIQVLDLNESVAEFGRMLRRLIGEDVEFRTRLDPELGRIKADPGQVQQIIMNLALNARDAMPQGGVLRVETDNVFLDEEYAAGHGDAAVGPHVRLTVGDTGHGMTPDVLAHIFEPFFTTKPVGKGTGLGLSSVYGIVKQSGGCIDVRSEPGKGSVFRIHFPIAEPEGKRPDARAAVRPPASPRREEVILLAEDEASVRKFLVAVLVSQGYRVVEAKDGEEALELARKLPRIDLLLTDVVMPNLGGGKLHESLKAVHPGLRTLFISGYTQDDKTIKEPQDTKFLQKPFSRADLLARVGEALGPGFSA